MPEILILQHAEWELPGAYSDLLAERNLHGRVVRPDLGEALPEVRDVAAVIAMGGPMSVNDDDVLPWLAAEKQFVRAAVTADVPYFGTCLGAQLLAAALDAPVYPGLEPEYGMHAVTIVPEAADDPVFAGLTGAVDVFQWHGETFDLPVGADLLASSEDYPHQAFRVGRLAYGLQFHLEVTPELLATWLAVPQCRLEARQHLGHDAEEQLTKQVHTAQAGLRELARRIFHRWLAAAGRPPRPRAATSPAYSAQPGGVYS
jgi:GMP synthase (glutamine-hydrolysing)